MAPQSQGDLMQLRRAPPRAAKERPASSVVVPRHPGATVTTAGARRVTRSSVRVAPHSARGQTGDHSQPAVAISRELDLSLSPGCKRRAHPSHIPSVDSLASKRPRRSGPPRNYKESEEDDEDNSDLNDEDEDEGEAEGEGDDQNDKDEDDTGDQDGHRSYDLRRKVQSGSCLLTAADEKVRPTRRTRSHEAAIVQPMTGSKITLSRYSPPRRKVKLLAKVTEGIADLTATDFADQKVLTAPQADCPSLPWQNLPYLILVDIFTFAAAPLDQSDSVRWLLKASTTCRSWAEPALTALYRCPPLLTISMAHNLLELLSRPPSETMFNYRRKIESLHIDVGALASLTYKGRHLDIENLVKNCPRLVDLDFYHQKDQSPYRQLDDRLRWAYPTGFFKLLAAEPCGSANVPESWSSDTESPPQDEERSPTRLQKWRWSARMMGPEMSLDTLRSIHCSASFLTLRKITFVNFQRPSLNAKSADDPEVIANDKNYAEKFAVLLEVLPELTHLVLESSTAANDLLLPLLPKKIQHLELINCWDVTADDLAAYLTSHGQELRHLSLHHNQSLSLSFLPLLGVCCPRLESLRMNLTYYNHHLFYNDSNPIYDELLLPDQVPIWPRTIQVVELENMRKWSAEAAEMFFQSFIDSAPDLPSLRCLNIKAMLDIPWRQRCAIRDKWEARLKQCLLRKAEDPEPWTSLADVYGKGKTHKDEGGERRHRPRKQKSSRRSGRISANISSSSSRASSATRGLRKLDRGRISYREPDTESEDGTDDELEGSDQSDGEAASHSDVATSPECVSLCFVHGLCEVVDLRFDNQKPTETQYSMEDFLNSDDAMSDDDWDGDRDGDDDNYAW